MKYIYLLFMLILLISPLHAVYALPGSVEFYGAHAYGTPQTNYHSMQTGDYDGDGIKDVMLATANKLTVYFGKPDGSFFMPPVTAFSSGFQGEIFPHTADLNNDGRSDLVFINRDPATVQKVIVSVFGNSNRTFSSPVYFNPNNQLDYINVSDYDADGIVDIFGSGYYSGSSRIAIYKGLGNGVFTFTRDMTTSGSTDIIEFGDLNNDNLPDLIFNDSDFLKMSKNLGGGSFAPAVSLGSATFGFSSYKISDVNNDGNKDIVALERYTFDPEVFVWLNQGNFNFIRQPNFTINSSETVTLQSVADIDNDQINDLIFSSANRTVIRKGAGNGTFALETGFSEGSGNGFVTGDFNRDGWLDIASVQQNEFGNQGSGSFAVFANQRNGTFRSAPALSTGTGTKDLKIADFNNDGLKDFVVVNQVSGGGPGPISVIFQLPGNNYSDAGIKREEITGVGVNPASVITGDFNRDGRIDIIVVGRGAYGATQNVVKLINNGNNTFTESLFQIGADEIYDAAAGDFNRDGNLDLVTSGYTGVSVSMGNANGSFNSPTPYLQQIANNQITLGDFNNDQKTDIAVISYNTSKIAILLNNGSGAFSVSPVLSAVYPSDIAAGDLNSDGNLDIIAAEANGIGVYLGVGTGAFSSELIYPIRTVTASNVALGDFNGDAKLDVAATSGTNSITVLLNNGSGGLVNETVWSCGGVLKSILASDINNDQKTDLVYGMSAFSYGYTKFLFNLTEKQSQNINTSFDYDGDGKADVSVFRPSAGAWYLNNSTSGFAAFNFGISTDKLVPADYDGDGKTDVAVFRDGNWYRLNSSNNSFSAVTFGQSGDIPQAGDFDGDGRADQAVYRSGIWYLNRSTAEFSVVSFGIASDKPVAADYDGDGKTDVAVYRDGNWYYLRSSDGSFAAVAFGQAGDVPVPADYDGDGKTDQAVYRAGIWYLNRSTGGFSAVSFGIASDKPVPADYDGDGKVDVAVYRNGNWYILQSTNGFTAQSFGQAGDLPTPNAFVP